MKPDKKKIKELKDDFDIIGYLDDRAIEYTTEGRNVSSGWIGIICPYCDDTSNHMGIHQVSKNFSCWRCAESGDVITLIQEIEQCSFPSALNILSTFGEGPDPHLEPTSGRPTSAAGTLPKPLLKEFPLPHRNFLTKRKFNPDYLIEKYDLWAMHTIGRFAHRIIVPIYMEGELASFVGRDVTEKAEMPYKNAAKWESKIPAKDCLYNIDNAEDVVILVEGITDVWRIGDGAVATLGSQVTHRQIEILSDYKAVYVLFDKDAESTGDEVRDMIIPFTKSESLDLPYGDPDKYLLDNPNEIRDLKKLLKSS